MDCVMAWVDSFLPKATLTKVSGLKIASMERGHRLMIILYGKFKDSGRRTSLMELRLYRHQTKELEKFFTETAFSLKLTQNAIAVASSSAASFVWASFGDSLLPIILSFPPSFQFRFSPFVVTAASYARSQWTIS